MGGVEHSRLTLALSNTIVLEQVTSFLHRKIDEGEEIPIEVIVEYENYRNHALKYFPPITDYIAQSSECDNGRPGCER